MDVSIERILALKFLPIVDFESIINAEALLETMLEQSVPILQVNFKNPQQLQQADVIGELTKKYPEMKIGAGFFYSSEDAEIAIKKGAQFVVSSVLAKDLPVVASKYNVPAIISGFTPTEIYDAHKTQSDLVQIFPASQLHYKSIVSILEYLPDANFILTGGLTISSALEFLRFGAKAVALKGALFSKIDLLEENYQMIGNSIRNFRSRVQHN
ncbi:MAG: bifunctional 4-hydroxy-2-oxoglutarate aldolase/2-dehydro-3-deoxy-phosphogluconate aldolase [Spirochaetota bacterium]|nr:bifunctional 4-hydroxy-2-oxoglutarate aldolase/2-dehydro-3-deoxy-phosphogluconate aldolase [Spirochaetota bacterium]